MPSENFMFLSGLFLSFYQAVSLNEAKSLLKEGGDVIKPLYEYWMNKRKKLVRKCKAYLHTFQSQRKLSDTVSRKVTHIRSQETKAFIENVV